MSLLFLFLCLSICTLKPHFALSFSWIWVVESVLVISIFMFFLFTCLGSWFSGCWDRRLSCIYNGYGVAVEISWCLRFITGVDKVAFGWNRIYENICVLSMLVYYNIIMANANRVLVKKSKEVVFHGKLCLQYIRKGYTWFCNK